MKAITLTQPWATLVAIGAKKIETRSWSTSYRGPLAIHAAKGFPKEARAFTADPVCYEAIKLSGPHPLMNSAYPLGAVLATCRLVTVKLVVHSRDALGPCADAARMLPPDEPELWFGNYESGRYAWILDDVRQFAEPIPAKGALGLWEWEPIC
jgi:hypothetical protein